MFTSWNYYDRGGELDSQATQSIAILDPSLGRNERSDWQAIVVLRFADSGPVLQESEELVRLPPRELVQLFLDVAEEHDCIEMVLEAIGFQELLEVLAEEDPRWVRSLPPMVKITGQAQSKHVRIATLATAVKQGHYLLPSDRSCHRTERQGLDYGEPKSKVDALDAGEMGLRRIRQLRRGVGGRRPRTGGRRRDMSERPAEDDPRRRSQGSASGAAPGKSATAPGEVPRKRRRRGGNRRRGGGRRGGGF